MWIRGAKFWIFGRTMQPLAITVVGLELNIEGKSGFSISRIVPYTLPTEGQLPRL